MPTITSSRGYASMKYNIDTREVERAIKNMDDNSGKVMAQAISDALRRQATRSQNYINQSVPSRQIVMGQRVADSITVETFGDGQNEAEVVFGSDPIGEGGVVGSRGGKLAIMLERGVQAFPYPFTFKTIDPSPSFAIGSGGLGNFINAKANASHPGFSGIGWLAQAYAEVVPEIEREIMFALQEAFA